MQSWTVIGPDNEFEQSLEIMRKEFGLFFVILPAKKIKQYANLIERASGSKVSFGLVRYSDDPMARSLTVKDVNFSYQNEFRFFTGQCSKLEFQDKFLNLPDINNLLLDAKSLKLVSSNGFTNYFSVGSEETVTVKP